VNSPRIQTPVSWFDRLGGSEITGSSEYPFRLRVLIAGYRVTPRHSMFDYFLEMGSGFIPKILKHESLGLDKGASLLFVLPERWMSVHEQQAFLYSLEKHPEACDISAVDIVTQGALIVGGVKGSLTLFQIADDDPEGGLLSNEFPAKHKRSHIQKSATSR